MSNVLFRYPSSRESRDSPGPGSRQTDPQQVAPGARMGFWLLSVWLMLLSCGGCNDAAPPANTSPSKTPVVASAPQAAAAAAAIRFSDVTAAAGLTFRHEAGATGKKWYPETMGAGGGFWDYDGDGRLDMVLVNGRRWPGERQTPEPTLRLYRNQGDGSFQDVTAQSHLDIPLYGMGLAAADYDNDGDADLLLTGYQQTLLFRNNGDGTFTAVQQAAGIAQGAWTTAAAFVDIDRDGWLDLVIGSYVDWDPGQEAGLDCTYGTPQKDYCAVKYFRGQGLTLYRNRGDGSFIDVTAAAGVAAPGSRVLGLAIIDYNQDGWPDVLVANDLTPTLLFANQGHGVFQEISVPSGLVLDEGGMAFAGMGLDAATIGNDDQLCIAIGNFVGQPTTLHCQSSIGGRVRPDLFLEQSQTAGIASATLRMVTFGLFFFDADLDGWQDLFMLNGHVVNEERLRHVPYAQPPQLFRNLGNGTFTEVASTATSGLTRHLIGRGAAYGDYDQDGDLDLLLTTNQGPAYLLRNDTPRQGHYVHLVTEGRLSNRDGIGARVHLYTTRRRLSGMVRTGGSYLSQSALALTFGLAADEAIVHLDVHWPSGLVDRFQDVPRDTPFVAREGASAVSKPVVQRAGTPAPTAESFTLKHTAMVHYQAGRLEAATAAFQQVLQQQPDDYISQQYLIELYWRQGAKAAAQALLERMSQHMPEGNFLTQFAFHLEASQLYDLADAVYRTAIQRDPQLAEAYYRLGKNALRARRYDEALHAFRQALQHHATLVDAVHGMGLVYAEQGQNAAAEERFRAAVQLVPDFAEAYTHLGALYSRTGRLDAAVTAYRQALALQPDQAVPHHNLGVALAAQGQTAAAKAQFLAALQLQPQLVAAHNDLGTLYAEQGDIPQALEQFRAALQSDAASVQAHYNLALAYGATGQMPAMQQELQTTVRLDPQHVEAHLTLGTLALQQNAPETALLHIRQAMALNPRLAQAHYLLAVTYAQLGQADAMLAPLQEAVRLSPQHPQAHSALAALYFKRQQYDRAWHHAEQAAHLGAPVQPLLDALRQVGAPRP